MKDEKGDEIVVVYTRLFKSDIEKIKQRATNRGFQWQTYLRSWIHKQLKKPDNGVS